MADAGCRNTVFGAEAQEASGRLEDWLETGIRHFRLEFAIRDAHQQPVARLFHGPHDHAVFLAPDDGVAPGKYLRGIQRLQPFLETIEPAVRQRQEMSRCRIRPAGQLIQALSIRGDATRR